MHRLNFSIVMTPTARTISFIDIKALVIRGSNMETIEKDMVLAIADIIREEGSRVIWIRITMGWGDGTAFYGPLKRLTVKALDQISREGPFDHVLTITSRLPSVASGRSYRQSKEQIMIAEALGVCEEEDYKLLSSDMDYENSEYHQYLDVKEEEELVVLPKLAAKVYKKLAGKSHLLIVDGLERPIRQEQLLSMGLPFPATWNNSWWLITTPYIHVWKTSKSVTDVNIHPEKLRRPHSLLLLEAWDILSSLFPAYDGVVDPTDAQAVVNCLFYSLLLGWFSDGKNGDEIDGIQVEELVKHWIEAGMLDKLIDSTTTKMMSDDKQQEHVVDDEDKDLVLFDIGKALLDMFVSRSLVRHTRKQSRVIPTEASQAIICHTDEFVFKGEEIYWRENGYRMHASCIRGIRYFHSDLTTLILRGCSELHYIPDDLFHHTPSLTVLDLSYADLTFLPSSLFCLKDLRLLSLKGCQNLTTLASSSTDSPVHALPSLHVLDASYTNIKSLPRTLYMPCLTDFLLEGCASLLNPPPFLESLENLRILRLTDSQITTFPESAFRCMERLRVLDLSRNHHLISLPGSLSRIAGPKEIHLHDCRALRSIQGVGNAELKVFSLSNNDHLMLLPESFREARNLEEIHLKDCRALKDINAVDGTKLKILTISNNDNLTSLPEWFFKAKELEKLHLQNCRAVKEINVAGNISLRSFFLSGSLVVRLSLRGCKNLESIKLLDLEELESLDLSFTRISELPAKIFGLPKLRHFEMVAAQHLRRFPWHDIRQLPKQFIFDHCSCRGNITLDSDDGNIRASIFVDDPRFFYSFTGQARQRLVDDEQKLRFDITISPCDPRCKKEEVGASGSRFIQRGEKFRYKSSYFTGTDTKCVEEHSHIRHLCRHLTMVDNNRFPTSGKLKFLFDVVESLSISDDTSLRSLSDISTMDSLKECMLKECHDMEYVVGATGDTFQQRCLEILCVSRLPKLTTLFFASVPNYYLAESEFGSLKHIHIEHCLRLEKLFPSDIGLLPSLETLTIKFCDGLREIIYKHRDTDETIYPQLHTVILLELPKLQHFREDLEANMPSLKTLHIRGCLRLRRIPLLGKVPEIPDQVTEVSGELHWWNKLTWEHYDEHGLDKTSCIRFKPKPDFTSSRPTVRGRPRRKKANKQTSTSTI